KLLEAQTNHVGGRIRTLRENNSYGELGAMRIPKNHRLTRKYIEEFNLKLRPFVQDNPETYAYVRNKKSKRTESGYLELKDLFNLNPNEINLNPDQIFEDAILKLIASLTEDERTDIFSKAINLKKIKDLDQLSLYNQFKKSGFSIEAIEYCTSIYGLTTYLQTALIEHIKEELDSVWTSGFDEIIGGMDLLPQAFKKELKGRIEVGAKIYKISQSNGKPQT